MYTHTYSSLKERELDNLINMCTLIFFYSRWQLVKHNIVSSVRSNYIKEYDNNSNKGFRNNAALIKEGVEEWRKKWLDKAMKRRTESVGEMLCSFSKRKDALCPFWSQCFCCVKCCHIHSQLPYNCSINLLPRNILNMI